jgi:hypothetical protein
MSVDYYSCDCCGEALYEEFVGWCEECERKLCMDCLENTEELDWNERSPYIIKEVQNGKGYIKKEHCPYCSGVTVDDCDLLEFVLKKFNLSREEAIKLFKSES